MGREGHGKLGRGREGQGELGRGERGGMVSTVCGERGAW